MLLSIPRVWDTSQQAILPTLPQDRAGKIRKGYPFPMLAIQVFNLFCLYFPLRRKSYFAELIQKKNAAISKKDYNASKTHIRFCRTFYLSSFSTSLISFAVAVTIRIPLSLMVSSNVSSCRRCVSFVSGFSKRNWSTDIS